MSRQESDKLSQMSRCHEIWSCSFFFFLFFFFSPCSWVETVTDAAIDNNYDTCWTSYLKPSLMNGFERGSRRKGLSRSRRERKTLKNRLELLHSLLLLLLFLIWLSTIYLSSFIYKTYPILHFNRQALEK